MVVCTPLAFTAFGAFWLTLGVRHGGSVEILSGLVSALGLAASGMVLGCTRALGDFSTPLRASALTKAALVLSVIAVGGFHLGIDAYMAVAATVQVGTAGLLLRRLRKTVGVSILRLPIAEDLRVIPSAIPFGITVVLEAASLGWIPCLWSGCEEATRRVVRRGIHDLHASHPRFLRGCYRVLPVGHPRNWHRGERIEVEEPRTGCGYHLRAWRKLRELPACSVARRSRIRKRIRASCSPFQDPFPGNPCSCRKQDGQWT